MSPVTGIRGTSALKSFFCPPVDDVFELLSATSDISALPSKTNVFKMVSMSPSDSCTWVDVHVKCMQWNAVNKIILLITELHKNVPSGSLGQVDFLTRKVTLKAYLVHTSHPLTKLLTTTRKLSGPRQAKWESTRLPKGQMRTQPYTVQCILHWSLPSMIITFQKKYLLHLDAVIVWLYFTLLIPNSEMYFHTS